MTSLDPPHPSCGADYQTCSTGHFYVLYIAFPSGARKIDPCMPSLDPPHLSCGAEYQTRSTGYLYILYIEFLSAARKIGLTT